MDAFLNELSLHAQYQSVQAIGDALRVVNRVLARLTELDEQPKVFFDKALYYSRTVGDTLLSSSLKHMPDKSLSLQFKRLLHDRLSGREWSAERQHVECAYMWNERNVLGSSVAELAERRLAEGIGFLLNFRPSLFTSFPGISIVKEHGGEVEVDCVSTEEDFHQWCERTLGVAHYSYDPACGRPPMDRETALIDRGRFLKTQLVNQGRSVYLEKSTHCYYCVDNLHGYGAHLEVFNANGDHIGEASLNGELDPSRADAVKRLYV